MEQTLFPDADSIFPSYPVDGIYLDSATQGLQPIISLDKQFEFSESINFPTRMGIHERSKRADDEYTKSMGIIAKFFNIDQEQLGWIPNIDTAWNLLLNSFQMQKTDGRRFFVSLFDHHSIIAPTIHAHLNDKINLVNLDLQAELVIDEFLAENLRQNDVVVLGHSSPILGLYRDVAKIIDVVKEKQATSVIDFSRTAGQKLIDFKKLNPDIALVDGSIDLLGPQNSGVLFIQPDVLAELPSPIVTSRNAGFVGKEKVEILSSIQKFESGAPSVSGMIGLSSSISFLQNIGMANIEKHRLSMQNELINRLKQIPNIEIVDPFYDTHSENRNRSNLVCISGEFHSHDVTLLLDEMHKIQVRSGLQCAHPGIYELGLEEAIQISTHVYNTKNEMREFVSAISGIISIFSN